MTITTKELALWLGITPDYLSQLIHGRQPGIATAKKIKAKTGLTLDRIFAGNILGDIEKAYVLHLADEIRREG